MNNLFYLIAARSPVAGNVDNKQHAE